MSTHRKPIEAGRPESATSLPPYVSEHAEGAVLAVVTSPKSSLNRVGPAEGDVVRVRVTAAAVDGAANAALVRSLADAVGISKSRVKVIAGQTSRRKRVLFRGANSAELARRLTLE